MDGRVDPPSMAMAMISEGREQVIDVDFKVLLKMVMESLGARQMPVYTEMECGSQGIRVSVQIDMSFATSMAYAPREKLVLQGGPSQTKLMAENNAALKAIKHMREEQHIEIIDYSSRVVGGFEESRAGGHVNASAYSVDKVIAQWEVTMHNCKELAIKLARKDAACTVNHAYEKWDLYGTMKEFVDNLIAQFSEQMVDERAQMAALDIMRKKQHERTTERNLAKVRKGYLHTAIVQPKVILDYVLGYLGTCSAQYSNMPNSAGLIRGVAKIYIPAVPGIKFCGNIEIKGTGRSSMDAEQDAALQALLFMEQNYKINIKDVNHTDRICSQQEHNKLVDLLEDILAVAARVKRGWGQMVKIISTERKKYMHDANFVYPDEGEDNKREAYRFCAKAIKELDEDSAKRYENCKERFGEMIELECKLDLLRTELELD